MLLFVVESEECLKYLCNITAIGIGICAIKNDTAVNLTRCEYGYRCSPPSVNNFNSSCIESTAFESLYPGDHCETSNQCLYESKCIKNICTGKKVGENCASDNECDVELYCNKTCRYTGDNCENGERCASNKVCNKGRCIYLGEISDGNPANKSEACARYYLVDGMCKSAPKLIANSNYTCPDDKLCKYSDNTTKP